MINEELKIEKKEKETYPPLPKNIYQAQILDVNLVEAKGQFAKEGEKNLAFQFTLLEGKDKDESLRGRNVWDNFVNPYLYIGKNGKNSLYRIFEAVIGRELTPEEEVTLDQKNVNGLVGKQIRISVEPKQAKNGNIYNNIVDYFSITQDLPPLTDEEKEKSTVKEKDEDKEIVKEFDEIGDKINEYGDSEIKLEDIPFN